MPMYEYHCSKCDKNFEVLQKFSDGPLRKHAGCGGKVERVLSAPAFQFKGSGWYVTDYGKGGVKPSSNDSSEKKSGDSSASDAKSNDSKSDSKSESKTESKSESKSESKPESKSESKSASKSASKSSAK
jgi:putative FmdB family regulatory protein